MKVGAWIFGLLAVMAGLLLFAQEPPFLKARLEYEAAAKGKPSSHVEWLNEQLKDGEHAVSLSVLDEVRGFPVVVTPKEGGSRSLEAARDWALSNTELLKKIVLHSGAVLFRGFDIKTAVDFEVLAKVLEPNLENIYLGTSPRIPVEGTSYVFTASEFPGPIVIPAHAEMSFLQNPPRSIMFYAHRPNSPPGGETPVTDLRAVWDDLDPALLSMFGKPNATIRSVRSYFDEGKTNLKLFNTKSWQQMFSTKLRDVALAQAAKEGFTAHFTERGSLVLENESPVSRIHPETGRSTWHNHLQVFHPGSIPSEYAVMAERTGSWWATMMNFVARAAVWLYSLPEGEIGLGQYASLGDGTPVPSEIMHRLRALLWKHTAVYAHQQGDVVFLDNWRLAHGRQPYSGPRSVYVAWGGPKND